MGALQAVSADARATVLDELRVRLANRSVAHGPVVQGPARSTVRPASAPTVDPAVLPVLPVLAELLPDGGLRRGSVVAVLGPDSAGGGVLAPGVPGRSGGLPCGATSLLLTLLAAASAAGSWAAVVGVGDLGALAAAELGVDLARLALVPTPGPNLTGIVAALLDGMDLLAVAGVERLSAAERSRLAARARQQGSVLLPLGAWPGADVVLRCSAARWTGVGSASGRDAGRGRLRERELVVSAGGRGRLATGGSVLLRLPGSAGQTRTTGQPRTTGRVGRLESIDQPRRNERSGRSGAGRQAAVVELRERAG